MQTFLVAVLLLLFAMLALGIGLAFGRPPLQRSCGAGSCLKTCADCPRIREPT